MKTKRKFKYFSIFNHGEENRKIIILVDKLCFG